MEEDYSAKIRNLEVRDLVLEELKNAITSGELDSIIEKINSATMNIDNTIARAENYLPQIFKQLRRESTKIRELASKLVTEHIEKIRIQLINQPPPFLSEIVNVS